ncbi:MAG TPA: hypothetical protein VFQ45_08190 [Longimicrobium sp.]|nr:hypothetical protein [Longimicrobium sp.]
MRSAFYALLALTLAAAMSACEGDSFLTDATVIRDTIELAAPGSSAELASAIDITNAANGIAVRRPERLEDAQQWDLALRTTESGGLALRTFEAPGQGLRGAGLSLQTTDFEALERAPRNSSEYTSGLVNIAVGNVFTVRSRQFGTSLGFACTTFAKLKVVAVDAAAGTARFAIMANAGCDDERLVAD